MIGTVICVVDTQLIHVRVPIETVKSLDEIDPHRSRAEKVTEALTHYIDRRRLAETVASGAASLSAEERSRWSSDEAVDTWVRERRSEYDRGESP